LDDSRIPYKLCEQKDARQQTHIAVLAETNPTTRNQKDVENEPLNFPVNAASDKELGANTIVLGANCTKIP
jgi:hypothetical protein